MGPKALPPWGSELSYCLYWPFIRQFCLARMFCPLCSETLLVPQGWTLEAGLGVTPLV